MKKYFRSNDVISVSFPVEFLKEIAEVDSNLF